MKHLKPILFIIGGIVSFICGIRFMLYLPDFLPPIMVLGGLFSIYIGGFHFKSFNDAYDANAGLWRAKIDNDFSKTVMGVSDVDIITHEIRKNRK